MGSCLSPSVADLVMDILLDDVISRLPFTLPFLKKYVDDLITTIPMDMVDQTLTVFNSYCPSLQFTIEREMDGKLPFLDMVIERDPSVGSISTSWYQKPTSSGRMLNFLSAHNLNQKVATATEFVNRVFSLSSSVTNDNIAIIKKQLRNNNYPAQLINVLIRKRLQRTNSPPLYTKCCGHGTRNGTVGRKNL